jgi:hypothetical protein
MKRVTQILAFVIATASIQALAYSTATSFRFPLNSGGWYESQDFCVLNGGKYHLGEDLVANSGTELPVYAPAAGQVKHNASVTGYGRVVIVEHRLWDGSYVCSVHGHMRAANIVSVGTDVSKGTLLGYLSNDYSENGGYTFTHLHFGIRGGAYTSTWVYYGYGSSCNGWYDPSDFIATRALRLSSAIDVSPDPIVQWNQVTIEVDIYNDHFRTFNGTLFAALHESNGDFRGDIDSEYTSIAAYGSGTYYFFKTEITSPPDQYQIWIKSTVDSTSWPLVPPGSYTNPIPISVVGSTAVLLSRLVAIPGNGRVEVQWETELEVDNAGFNILRSEQPNTPFEAINSSLIIGGKSSYSVTDDDVNNGHRYSYILEDVDISGQHVSHGPVTVTPLDPDLDCSGQVDTRDLQLLAESIYLHAEHPGFCELCDIDGDMWVDEQDLLLFLDVFDQQYGAPADPVLSTHEATAVDCDLDGNGMVNRGDIGVLARSYMLKAEEEAFMPAADIVHSGLIDRNDAVLFVSVCKRDILRGSIQAPHMSIPRYRQ